MRSPTCTWLACLLLALVAAGCAAPTQGLLAPFTSVRPVAHVGVLAPFEGIYRRSGYGALDSVRSAVAAAPPAHTGIIPLALDTSLDPARAAAKLVASTSVRAVVGPLTPQEGTAAAPALGTIPWLAPWAVTEMGFVAPQETLWLEALAQAVGEAAHVQGAKRLLVGGSPPAWEPLLRAGFGPPAVIQYGSTAKDAAARPGDALVWLGNAADGAASAAALRAALADAPIWLAPWAVDPVFFEHLSAAEDAAAEDAAAEDAAAGEVANVFTVLWEGPHAAAWATAHPQGLPSAYLMYEATVQAAAIATQATAPMPAQWTWRAVRVGPEGIAPASLP